MLSRSFLPFQPSLFFVIVVIVIMSLRQRTKVSTGSRVVAIRWDKRLPSSVIQSRSFATITEDSMTSPLLNSSTLSLYELCETDSITPIAKSSLKVRACAMEFVPDSDLIATGTVNGNILLHKILLLQDSIELNQCDNVNIFETRTPVSSINARSDGTSLVASCETGDICITEIASTGIRSDKKRDLISSDSLPIHTVQFMSPTEKIIVSAGASGTTSIFDLRAPGNCVVATLPGTIPIFSLSCHPRMSEYIVTGNISGDLTVWDQRSPHEFLTTQPYHNQTVWDVKFDSEERDTLYSCGNDGRVLWHTNLCVGADDPKEQQRCVGYSTSSSISTNGLSINSIDSIHVGRDALLLSGGDDDCIRLFNAVEI